MVARGLVLLAPLTPLDATVFSRLTVGRWIWPFGGWYCCAPSLPSILMNSRRLMVEARYGGAPLTPARYFCTLQLVLTVKWRV